MKTVYIAGCWDYCHEGHRNILNKARELGDFLVVAVNSDAFIRSYKGIKMDNNEYKRISAIRELGVADVVFILEDHESQRKYVDVFKPDIIVHGSDWRGDELYKQMNITLEQIEKYGIEFVYPEYTAGVSSTQIRETNKKLRSNKTVKLNYPYTLL
jgi:cytidyltransferase-like protein